MHTPAVVYLDSSVALYGVLDGLKRSAVEQWIGATCRIVSSRLLHTEVIRTLRRQGINTHEATALFDRIAFIDIDRSIHTFAESIQQHTKTLDALHLATAMLIDTPLTLASHDSNMLSVAEELGLHTIDPIAKLN